ncbi:hypothetical protein [Nocardia altamirensis]|uniref:hypothetical protein n=1 Tax=Nocardia altamirensis TaxID=472158 RepID=UPI00083FF119|nr:hypothetical protein [Nocardia altamirensis]
MAPARRHPPNQAAEITAFVGQLRSALTDLHDDPLNPGYAGTVLDFLVKDWPGMRQKCDDLLAAGAGR